MGPIKQSYIITNDQSLIVCLLLNWLCCLISCEFIPLSKKHFFKKTIIKKMLKAGGVILMAINNTLMMIQTGFPTGKCEVRSR